MVVFPFCKINLGLQILNKRSDGYHSISTCFYPVPWTDILEIVPADKLTFSQTGITIPGSEQDNLCLKAFHILQEKYDLKPVSIHLHKLLPTGAGLGGGSSDAAFTLRTLNTIYDLKISSFELMQLASGIGSDCAFFLQDYAMLGTERGEVLQPTSVDLKGFYLVILKPDIHVATAAAYNGVIPKMPDVSLTDILRQPVDKWKGVLENDFEQSIFKKYPAISDIKSKLYSLGAVYASMSGSGSSVFGIFDKKTELPSDLSAIPGWQGYL